MKLLLLTFMILVIFLTAPAFAGCIHNDISYPTGTRIGEKVCQPDGTWQKR